MKLGKPVCSRNKEDKNVESKMQKSEYNMELQTSGERARHKSVLENIQKLAQMNQRCVKGRKKEGRRSKEEETTIIFLMVKGLREDSRC